MKEFLNTAIYLLCVLGAVWLVITFVGQRTEVEGASMAVSYTHLDVYKRQGL